MAQSIGSGPNTSINQKQTDVFVFFHLPESFIVVDTGLPCWALCHLEEFRQFLDAQHQDVADYDLLRFLRVTRMAMDEQMNNMAKCDRT